MLSERSVDFHSSSTVSKRLALFLQYHLHELDHHFLIIFFSPDAVVLSESTLNNRFK